jgi:hypothetical protein
MRLARQVGQGVAITVSSPLYEADESLSQELAVFALIIPTG